MTTPYTHDNAHKFMVNHFDEFRVHLDYLNDQLIESGFADLYGRAFGHPYEFYIAGFGESGIFVETDIDDYSYDCPHSATMRLQIPWDIAYMVFTDYEAAVRLVEQHGALKCAEDKRIEDTRIAKELERQRLATEKHELALLAELKKKYDNQV